MKVTEIIKTTAYISPIIIVLFIIASCISTNLKSQEPDKGFDLLSEKDEVKFRHYVDACIHKDFAVLSAEKHAEVYHVIEEIGQSLTKVSNRPDLKYTFKILITDLVNAFAAP